MIRDQFILVLLVTGMLAVACSGASTSPILPGIDGPGLTSGHNSQSSEISNRALWGVWEVGIDTSTWDVNITPLRGVQFTVDVVKFLQPPDGDPLNLSITLTDKTELKTQGLLSLEMGLLHPFPGFDQFTGFDVYGVFIGPGSMYGQYDSDVVYTNGVDDAILLNADGYTRWMNPTEFPDTGKIFDFTPGALGMQNIDLFTSTINAYKYFTDGLDKDEDVGTFLSNPTNTDARGTFKPGSFNEREYDIRFPMIGGNPYLVFQYAIIASWVNPDKALSGDPGIVDVPGDFPITANADEAIFLNITDNSDLYYTESVSGGDISLGLEIYDWRSLQAGVDVADEIYQIVVEGDSNVVPGGYVTFDGATLAATAAPGTSAISSVFQIEIAECTPQSSVYVPLLITVESFQPDTFDPGNGIIANDDRLASYFLYNVPVNNENPLIIVLSPNGGETLWMAMSHEITWDPGSGGVADVKIEWSTDNFVSDISTIIDSTENDGSFIWKPIPVEDTTTARIRISDVLGTDSDTSDGDFTIALPVWLDFEDEIQIDETSNSWSGTMPPYDNTGIEFSPAISQDIDGMVHVYFYNLGVNYSSMNHSCDTQIRSSTGSTWYGCSNFFGTSGGTGMYRADSAKIAPSHAGHSWAAIARTSNSCYISDVDRMFGGPGFYTFDGISNNYGAGKYIEIATDSAGYIFSFGDNNTATSIYLRKSNQIGLTGNGGAGQMGSTTLLTDDGFVSHSRSWVRQGQGIALIYSTSTGEIRLAETTDAPTNDTWDTSEIVWDGTGYSDVTNPALCTDSSEKLFAIWTALNSSTSEYEILASMRETVDGPWSDPAVVTTSVTEFDDIHISSAEVLLPSGTTEDVATVAWETGDAVGSALSPLDLLAFLPEQDVSATGVIVQDPDVMCIDDTWEYTYDVLFAYSWDDAGDWDCAIRHADFETP